MKYARFSNDAKGHTQPYTHTQLYTHVSTHTSKRGGRGHVRTQQDKKTPPRLPHAPKKKKPIDQFPFISKTHLRAVNIVR